MTDGEGLHITPANLAECGDLRSLFGAQGAAGRCQCQRYRLAPGEAFADSTVAERRLRLAQQTGCDAPENPTSGLVAWFDEIPVGWCAVGPRIDLAGLTRVFTVPWKGRDEDRKDSSVWAVTCVFTRVGYRRRGIASALIGSTPSHARDHGARCVEGYPLTTAKAITEELHVGIVSMFTAAGFHQVSAPTTRRVVMRMSL